MGLKRPSILWAEAAEASLDRILSYIEAENADVAKQLWSRVMGALEQALEFPEMAAQVPDLDRTYREILTVRPFRVVYRMDGKDLQVIAILRREQDFDPGRFLVP
jgi:plasmid stabilization system protein ParE